MTVTPSVGHPPETLEGWYVLHQIFTLRDPVGHPAAGIVPPTASEGWSAVVRLIGSTADVMVMHFRASLDAIGEAQRTLAAQPAMKGLVQKYAFLSVTEAGLYHITA